MKTLIVLVILVFSNLYTHAKTSDYSQKDTLMTLDEIPEWILQNIHFPDDAYKYGVAGIEQLCISASWEGNVFLSSKLNTLNPALEREIMDVIVKAPKCQFTGSQPKDIYKYMLIDFYDYIPESRQNQVKRVTMHTPPRFTNMRSGPFNGKEKFIEWIFANIRIPSTLKCYTDTISFQYEVTEKGKVDNVSVLHCNSDIVQNVLEKTLTKSPKWEPAIVDANSPIRVIISDKIIVRTDSNGILMPYEPYVADVYCNSNRSPEHLDTVVLNPEVKPLYKGASNFAKDIMQNVAVDRKMSLNGSFIIEKDGTVSDIDIIQGVDVQTDSIVSKAISQSKWTAAMQGGSAVRTIHSFGITRGPLKKPSRNYSYYDIFGKYFIAIQADPMRTSYGFIQRDGTISRYPFNNQGVFDFPSYYQGLMYYYKNTPRKYGNISKNYFDKLYKIYVKP